MATVVYAPGFGAKSVEVVEQAVHEAHHDFVPVVFESSSHPVEWIHEVSEALRRAERTPRILAGISIGAAVGATMTDHADALVLASLYPLFKENLIDPKYVDQAIHDFDDNESVKLTKDQVKYLEVLEFKRCVQKISKTRMPVAVMIGGNEVNRVDIFEESRVLAGAANTGLSIIPSVGRDIMHPRYMRHFLSSILQIANDFQK